MRIVFMGSPDFAIPSLEKLVASRHSVAAVVSGSDKRRGRGKRKTPTPVKAKALKLGIPVIEADDLNDPVLADKLRDLKPDLFVVVAFRILPEALLRIPAKGAINLHASLLPRYRGAAPIHRAIMHGDKLTGCTVFFLQKEVDSGNILIQKDTEIGPDETTGELYDRLKILGADLLPEALYMIESGTYKPVKQDEKIATPAPKIFQKDARLNFNKPAADVHNMIRAMNPFPGAWTFLDGQIFKIYRSRNRGDKRYTSGQLVINNEGVFVGCNNNAIELLEVQLEGKKAMNAMDFFNGYKGEMMFGGPTSVNEKKSG